jgi:hypothetical protein
MSNEINGEILNTELEATLASETEFTADIPGASVIINDYQVTAESTENGGKLTVKRGNEVQEMHILNGANVVGIVIKEVE